MKRTTASTRIEKMMSKYDERIKINIRFDIQRTFGSDNKIDHSTYSHLIDRVHMQLACADSNAQVE